MAENKENNKKKPASESLVPRRSPSKTSGSAKTQGKTAEAGPAAKVPAKNSKTAAAKKDAETAKEKRQEKKNSRPTLDENSLLFQLLPYLLGFLGIMTAFFMGFPEKTGVFGTIALVFRGLFSYAAWAIPVFLFFGAFKLKDDMKRARVGQKFGFGIGCILFLSILTALFFFSKSAPASLSELFGKGSFAAAQRYENGGAVGNFLGFLLYKATGSAAVFIASFAVLLLGLFQFGCTPEDILAYVRDKIREKYHDLRHKPHEKYVPEVHESKEALPKKASAPDEPARRHAAYRCNRDMAYHLTKKNIDVDISDRKPKKHSVFDTLEEEEKREEEKRRPVEENRLAAQRDEEVLSRGGVSDRAVTDAEEKTVQPENAETAKADADKPPFDVEPKEGADIAPSFSPDPAAFDSVKNSGRVESMVDPAAVDELSDGAKIDGIFADGAVIEAGGMAMNPSVLSEGDVLDPAKGSPVDSEVSDKEQGFEVESGKLTVSSRPTIEELYSYPPVDLLKEDPNPATFTVTDELKATAVKLVDTLSNFGVRTKITNISCGPTVTRYELQPEVGVRVKSIQNLSDDIALHLAANGVRIEAPIPGKDAVGIEIPNKTVSTVYIRDLIEDPKFRALKSRISVCLGMDVAGSPVYMDIAKMPHLLIAGATGMGKSVCINSFIISILYKARPDEVKFILIDPKKVEFSLYKGIPHLLVPVVNEPKKAAGALAWAVSEMERRFALIEEVGVRDIAGYNAATRNDPEKPHMSQIVIIIDELADLMMTAKDEVENSICRLAQKARAAGMHIVIGTQRPSVDVITGLIKANIPSRIACTVASQVDSRTIIDISGAEKLIGKGDMLFAPVGCLKPIRVQGSFVSDGEVEAVTDYLRANCKVEYDKSIIEDIEREAARCGEKKKKGADASDGEVGGGESLMDGDDMIMPAIQVAVSAGQLSTSLLQRKLSLGYARAARIVDTLEQMGVVSGFEGSKPRRVLITEEQYLEMKMHHDGGES